MFYKFLHMYPHIDVVNIVIIHVINYLHSLMGSKIIFSKWDLKGFDANIAEYILKHIFFKEFSLVLIKMLHRKNKYLSGISVVTKFRQLCGTKLVNKIWHVSIATVIIFWNLFLFMLWLANTPEIFIMKLFHELLLIF